MKSEPLSERRKAGTPNWAKACSNTASTSADFKLRRTSTASPRRFRNTPASLGADRNRLAELEDAVRQYLAW